MPPPQGGAFFGFAVIIAAALAAWAIIALVNVAEDEDSSDDYARPREADNDIQVLFYHVCFVFFFFGLCIRCAILYPNGR